MGNESKGEQKSLRCNVIKDAQNKLDGQNDKDDVPDLIKIWWVSWTNYRKLKVLKEKTVGVDSV